MIPSLAHSRRERHFDVTHSSSLLTNSASSILNTREASGSFEFHVASFAFRIDSATRNKENRNSKLLFILPPKGRQGRALDDSTEQFVETTRMGGTA